MLFYGNGLQFFRLLLTKSRQLYLNSIFKNYQFGSWWNVKKDEGNSFIPYHEKSVLLWYFNSYSILQNVSNLFLGGLFQCCSLSSMLIDFLALLEFFSFILFSWSLIILIIKTSSNLNLLNTFKIINFVNEFSSTLQCYYSCNILCNYFPW